MRDVIRDFVIQLLPILLSFLFAGISYFVARAAQFLGKKAQEVESNLSHSQLIFLQAGADMIVKAAEQLKQNGTIDEKKSWAISMLQDFAEKHNIFIDVSIVEALVEAAVQDGFTRFKVQ